mmetsp:Transcript_39069/g.85869  ORF Transcript_39069/g.85869 Transcript_39069/m.85869 type:complete len:244 (-) Transcript_39069:1035-1766(-)
MAAAQPATVRREAQAWLRQRAKGGHAAGARAQDRQGSRRHDQQEVPPRQARLPRRAQVRAARGAQAAREHADAVGADPDGAGALPYHRRHHVCQRGALGDRAGVHCAVGHHVDHDAAREARPPPLQADALPALRRRGAAARLRRQHLGRRAARGDPDGARRGGGRERHRLALRGRQAAAPLQVCQRHLVQAVDAAAADHGQPAPPRLAAALRPVRLQLLLPLRHQLVHHGQEPQHGHPRRAQV